MPMIGGDRETLARRRVAGAVDLVPGEDRRGLAGADLVEHALDDADLLLGLGIGRVDDVHQQLGAPHLLERALEGLDQLVRQPMDEAHGVDQ
jgi:hypothetical protein